MKNDWILRDYIAQNDVTNNNLNQRRLRFSEQAIIFRLSSFV